jgi:hypothetical protein
MANSNKEPMGSRAIGPMPRTNERQARRCSAHRTNGEPCSGWAIKGGSVCRTHGGAAPQTLQAARMRLLAAADPAAAELVRIALNRKEPRAVQLAAIRDLLDRAGLSARQVVDVTVSPWQEAIGEILRDNGWDGDVLLVPGDDEPGSAPRADAETGDSASTSNSELRRRSSVDCEGTTVDLGQEHHHDQPSPPQPARRARTRHRPG